MKMDISYIIIVIVLLVIILIIYDKQNIKLFDHFYEDITVKAYEKYNKFLKTPKYKYSILSGYENGRHVDELTDILEENDATFIASEKQYRILKNLSAKESIINSFLLGDIYNYNKDNKKIAAIHYTNVLKRLNLYPDIPFNNNLDILEPNPEHIVDRIEEFYLEHGIDNSNDISTARDNIRNARMPKNTSILNKIMPVSKNNIKKEYYKKKNIKSDPQNVHDTAINKQIKNKYENIKKLNEHYENEYTINDIKNTIKNEINDEKKIKKINNVIDSMVGSNNNLNDTEQNVLLNVWKRVNVGTNVKNKKESLYNSMENCVEKTMSGKELTVCSTGRCGKIIDSLTFIDTNEDISKCIKSSDIIRNEASSKTYNILQKELSKESQEVQNIYNTGNGDIKKIEKFENTLKNKITETLKNDYKDLPERLVNNIIDDCVAGIY